MIDPWKKIKESPVSSGYRKIIRKTFVLPDGKAVDFDIIEEGKTVCIFALTSENKVILAKQFRPGPEKVLYELPGGQIDQNEDPTEAMRRELLEETGYQGDIKLIGTNVDAAYSTKIRYNFVGTNCKKIQSPKPDIDEFLEVVEVSVQEFKRILATGENTDIETGYIGLHHLNLV